MLDKNTWNHLTVCKQIFYSNKEIFMLDRNTWNYLTVCKQIFYSK